MDDEQYLDVPFGGDGNLSSSINIEFIEKGIPVNWETYDEGPQVVSVKAGNNTAPLNFHTYRL